MNLVLGVLIHRTIAENNGIERIVWVGSAGLGAINAGVGGIGAAGVAFALHGPELRGGGRRRGG